MPVVTLGKSNSVTRDTYVIEGTQTSYPTSTTLGVGTGSNANSRQRALLFFDLGLIPNDAVINNAKLSVFLNNPKANTKEIHKVTSSWGDSVNWGTQPTFDEAVISSVLTPAAQGKYYEFDVKSLVEQWVNGISINYGILLKIAEESTLNSNDACHSFEGPNPPTLTIDYTIPTTGKKQVEYVGKGGIAYVNTTVITPTLPVGIQAGDLLVAQLINNLGSDYRFTAPSGWTFVTNYFSGRMKALAYKFAAAGETAPTFSTTSGSSAATGAVIHAFRNVKSIKQNQYLDQNNSTVFKPSSTTVTTDVTKTLFAIFNVGTGNAALTSPLSYTEGLDGYNTGYAFQEMHRYMYSDLDQTATEIEAPVAGGSSATGFSQLLVLEPYTNNPPTLTLSSPADNQTLAEGNNYPIKGSATDADSGNVMTVMYKINNGTARALASGVSDGSSSLTFDKALKYSNKRLWDGSTNVSGDELAENIDHILAVWSEDNQGGKSAEITRKFRVIWNRPPTISGEDDDLGTLLVPPTIEYSAVDPEGNTFTFTEYLNGKEIRSFTGTAGQNYTVQISHDAWIRLDLDVQHQIKIKATDSAGLSSERIYTFTRTETHIEFMLNLDIPDVQGHFILDGMPQRVLVTLERYIPEGAEIQSVKVCNNALDASPTWEDATSAVKANRGFVFTNTNKSAANWAINIWVIIAKGTATERVRLNGYGGAFD